MKSSIFTVILAILLALLPSCFYSDSELYRVEPIPGDPPAFSASTNLDTLYHPAVDDSLQVTYQVKIEGGELYYVYAVIANTAVYDSDSTQGEFWIYPELAVDSGLDTLYLDMYYSTNSNSLADKVGFEAKLETLKIAVDFNLEDVE
jgi:hypothetical protein